MSKEKGTVLLLGQLAAQAAQSFNPNNPMSPALASNLAAAIQANAMEDAAAKKNKTLLQKAVNSGAGDILAMIPGPQQPFVATANAAAKAASGAGGDTSAPPIEDDILGVFSDTGVTKQSPQPAAPLPVQPEQGPIASVLEQPTVQQQPQPQQQMQVPVQPQVQQMQPPPMMYPVASQGNLQSVVQPMAPVGPAVQPVTSPAVVEQTKASGAQVAPQSPQPGPISQAFGTQRGSLPDIQQTYAQGLNSGSAGPVGQVVAPQPKRGIKWAEALGGIAGVLSRGGGSQGQSFPTPGASAVMGMSPAQLSDMNRTYTDRGRIEIEDRTKVRQIGASREEIQLREQLDTIEARREHTRKMALDQNAAAASMARTVQSGKDALERAKLIGERPPSATAVAAEERRQTRDSLLNKLTQKQIDAAAATPKLPSRTRVMERDPDGTEHIRFLTAEEEVTYQGTRAPTSKQPQVVTQKDIDMMNLGTANKDRQDANRLEVGPFEELGQITQEEKNRRIRAADDTYNSLVSDIINRGSLVTPSPTGSVGDSGGRIMYDQNGNAVEVKIVNGQTMKRYVE